MNPSPHFLKENGMTSKIYSKTRRNSLGRRVVKGTHVQKITRDQMTGALDLEIIIDHRWFSQEGRDEMNPVKGYKKRQEAVDDFFGNAGIDTELSMSPNNDDKKYMGRMTVYPDGTVNPDFLRDSGGRMPDELGFWESINPFGSLFTYDTNPIFGLVYNYLPGGKAATLYHDYEYDAKQNNGKPHTDWDLALSIPGSFYGTWYSTTFGKPFSNMGNGK
jgi:hypothetical protein